MYNNYYRLLNIKIHHKIINIILFISFIILLIISLTTKMYSTYTIYGLYEDKFLKVDIPIEDDYKIINSKYLKVKNKITKIKISEISEIKVAGNINYQTYSLLNNDKKYDNEITEITFYYDKERIIKKIIKILF